jgi:hypothetical protein
MNAKVTNGMKTLVNNRAALAFGLGFFTMLGANAVDTAGRVLNNAAGSFRNRRAMRAYNKLSPMQKVFSRTPKR